MNNPRSHLGASSKTSFPKDPGDAKQKNKELNNTSNVFLTAFARPFIGLQYTVKRLSKSLYKAFQKALQRHFTNNFEAFKRL